MNPKTEEKLAKWLPVEVLISSFVSIVITSFLIGMAWAALGKDIELADNKADKNHGKVESLDVDIQSIKVDVEVTKEQVKKLQQQTDKNGETLNEIRQLLWEERRRN